MTWHGENRHGGSDASGGNGPLLDGTDDLLLLDQQICFALNAASRAFGSVYRTALKDLGLTYPQYLVMLVLWEDGELPVKQLGERLRLDSGTLSPLLKRLEAAGLIVRERSPQDERSVLVTPTEAGRALRAPARAVPRHILTAAGLPIEDVRALRELLDRVTANLDASGA
ncbi:MarR family winged helix-turn-helix transcriptional regulator [Streptomyces sp. TLI_171]|uniref:MarR family winged helix-turn-helix transcriptional regulator n=1 Tax=Streptomyces sp. TLI_171 TaxID=1938859 RepID=UPI000C188C1D|nr:MarR family transcriptional regulator [Streptomyces sp. TLI_171]RKE22880.1 DNA-binding MarR family transcriptional regulator [Streptomyces sp. TLI_171]